MLLKAIGFPDPHGEIILLFAIIQENKSYFKSNKIQQFSKRIHRICITYKQVSMIILSPMHKTGRCQTKIKNDEVITKYLP